MLINVYNFAEINFKVMTILGNVERVLHSIPRELIEKLTVYIEVDRESFNDLEKEVEDKIALSPEFVLTEQKVEDIGKCKVLTYNGYKIVIVINKDRLRLGTFYFAFKTKII